MVTEQDLNRIWKARSMPEADKQQLAAMRKRYQKRRIRRLLLMNLLFIAALGISIWIWFTFQPMLISTRAGLIIIVSALLYYLYQSNRLLPEYSRIGTMDGLSYTRALLRIAVREQEMLQRKFRIYTIVLSAGLMLYLYGYIIQMPPFWGWLSGIVTFGWILFSYIYLRPRQVRKLQHETEKHLQHFQALSKQF